MTRMSVPESVETRAHQKLRSLVAQYTRAKVAEVNHITERQLYRLLAGTLPSLRTAYELSDNGIEIKDWFELADS